MRASFRTGVITAAALLLLFLMYFGLLVGTPTEVGAGKQKAVINLFAQWGLSLTNRFKVVHYDKLSRSETQGVVVLEHFDLLIEDVGDLFDSQLFGTKLSWTRGVLPAHRRVQSWWKTESTAEVFEASISPKQSRDYVEFWIVPDGNQARLFIRSVRVR